MTSQSEIAFRDIYRQLLTQGKQCSPRGQLVLEVENFNYTLPPYVRFPNFSSRKLSLNYIKNEVLWYLRGNREDLSILKHAKMWQSLVNPHSRDSTDVTPGPSGSGTINSNYGQYAFGSVSPPSHVRRMYPSNIYTQFDAVIDCLTKDKDSRRASITILQPYHLLMETNDVPCTYSLNFRIRDDKLNMSVHMRSQDAVFGMGNDAPAFSILQEMVYVTLRDTAYPDLQLGEYHHIADSFHVYERHFDMLHTIVKLNDQYHEAPCPKIESIDEVRHLRGTIHLNYADGKNSINYEDAVDVKKLVEKSQNFIPGGLASVKDYAFSAWLLIAAHEAELKEVEERKLAELAHNELVKSVSGSASITPNFSILGNNT